LPEGRPLVAQRPFRAPHHSISDAGLIGGGPVPRPGEVSLAHNGVLFLDELPEFRRNALEGLRQPLEEGSVTIARASASLSYPARFMLVAAMNPCPCGYYTDATRPCSCAPPQVQRYRGRVSGPLLDRVDLQIETPPVPVRDLTADRPREPSAAVRARVEAARRRQQARYRAEGFYCNAQLRTKLLRRYCALDAAARALLESAMDRLGLSARAYGRILKVARTIADLEGSDTIRPPDVAEAIAYRGLR
jgi:magnesium chelatase family protein